MVRLFAGLEVPEYVRDVLGQLEAPLTGAKWVDPDDMHVTLRFAGDIEHHIADEFAGALATISVPVFSLRVSGLGTFGGADPTALWAGFDPSPELDRLHQKIERAARNAGLPPAARKFKPHITLARLRGASPDQLAMFLQHHGALRSEPFTVEDFVLFSSRPMTGGGPYGVEMRFPLEGAAPAFDTYRDSTAS